MLVFVATLDILHANFLIQILGISRVVSVFESNVKFDSQSFLCPFAELLSFCVATLASLYDNLY